MRVRGIVVTVAVLLGLSSASLRAQTSVEIHAPAPEKPRQFQIVEPGPATREVTRPREADFYGSDVRVRHEPAFIEPFVGQTQGGTKYGPVGLDLALDSGRQLRGPVAVGVVRHSGAGYQRGLGLGAHRAARPRIRSPLSRRRSAAAQG